MKYLITGGSGQLGHDIDLALKAKGLNNHLAPTHDRFDIINKDKVTDVIEAYSPDVIFHCAAYTAVDKAENEKDLCYDINVNGTKNIVEAAKKIGAKVVYISTDYVFDGTKDGIYVETDTPNPINHYGYTKYLGEQLVQELDDYLIVRISWVFGENGKNFVKTMLNLAKTNSSLSIVSDQIGSPTYTKDLASLLLDMVDTKQQGIFHATNEGFMSWMEFARLIFKINGIEIEVNPILTKDYGALANRPLNSKLSKDKLESVGLYKLPSVEDATKRFCKNLENPNK